MGVYETFHVECDVCGRKLGGTFNLGSHAEGAAIDAGWKRGEGWNLLLCPPCSGKPPAAA